MTFELRPYQQDCTDQFLAGTGNTALILPTGGGKTVIVSGIVHHWDDGFVVVIAHRQELVTQISTALARDGVEHTIIANKTVIKNATKLHVQKHGRCFYKVSSKVIVASVQTLVRRLEEVEKFRHLVRLWVIDECHHVLKKNQWGQACSLFPNARGLGVTATPIRADGKALGSQYDGVFDNMIVGEKMSNLINDGYLCPYRIFSPPTKSLDLSTVDISSSTGDYSKVKLARAVERSKIHGDIVNHYKRLAMGKRGVTFVPSVETAEHVALEFNAAGVPAEVVSAKTPDLLRVSLVDRLRTGSLLQLVNVDLFGEGFDLPAIEVVSMARPTKSYALFCQQFGRCLRILEGKTHGMIIDHVGNVLEHGLPDFNEYWTLGYYTEKKGTGGAGKPLYKVCPACTMVFERFLKTCPICGYVDKPGIDSERTIDTVDGDLVELDPAELTRLRIEKARIDGEPLYPMNASPMIRSAIAKRHDERQTHQTIMRYYLAEWTGREVVKGLTKSDIYRKFYLEFGIDVMTAQTGRNNDLLDRLAKTLGC